MGGSRYITKGATPEQEGGGVDSTRGAMDPKSEVGVYGGDNGLGAKGDAVEDLAIPSLPNAPKDEEDSCVRGCFIETQG